LVEHNLLGTINLLEYCKAHQAGFILLSTSRVYSVSALAAIRTKLVRPRYQLVPQKLRGLSMQGVSEEFSTEPPLSLYGAAKRASEQLAIEYGSAFDFPVWINRCGVLAGAGQFGKADQGVFSFWVHSYRWRKPLRYIGFDGEGHQVRDCLHPRDLISVLINQIRGAKGPVVCNFGGGLANSMSLRELSNWCAKRFGSHKVAHDRRRRPFDIRWLVLDCSRARNHWDWQPQTSIEDVLEEIALHADTRPDWLEITR
jgi:CDP-paratose 2-epimerase